jgi:uncharacterized membrane protein (UPF0182 family)
MPAFDMAPIHRQTSTVDAWTQSVYSVVDLRSVFAARLSGRIGALPMLIVILLVPMSLACRVPVRFRMVFDQSSSAQPVISLYICSERERDIRHDVPSIEDVGHLVE